MISIRKQVELKIKLERIFKPEVAKVFNSIVRDFKVIVAETGLPPRINDYKPIWITVLKKHYQRVQRAFTGSTKQADDQLLRLFLTWRNKFADIEAEYINETTQINMNEAIQTAMNQAAIELSELSTREISANATAILKRKLRNRIEMIINTETQKAAESAKFMEAETLSGVKPRLLGGSPTQKTDTKKKWTTVGDKFVRSVHREANGQIKGLYEPYVVGGEYLMHPGDSSLGASLSNLANCRCISMYIFI